MGFLRWLAAGLTYILSGFVQRRQTFNQGQAAGEAKEKNAAAEATAAAQREAKEVRNEVEALPDAELRKRASTWVRGAKPTNTKTD